MQAGTSMGASRGASPFIIPMGARGESILAVGPMLQAVADIGPAGFARRTDQSGRHLHLMERLIPDIVEPLGLRHARSDAGIDEVEEEQSGHALRSGSPPA